MAFSYGDLAVLRNWSIFGPVVGSLRSKGVVCMSNYSNGIYLDNVEHEPDPIFEDIQGVIYIVSICHFDPDLQKQ